MPRLSAFNSPYLLGFDQLEQLLDTISKGGGDGYPPYNIEQTGEADIRISLAVAGFSQEDLTVYTQGSQLIIRGKQAPSHADDDASTYLHKGIANRQFQRKFLLADGMIVSDAFLEHGLLYLDLTRPAPESIRKEIKVR